MTTLLERLSREIQHVINAQLSQTLDTDQIDLSWNIDRPAEFGDASTSIALKVAKIVKQSPRTIAQELVDALFKSEAIASRCSSITLAGPGFINFTLNDAAWDELAQELSESGEAYFKPSSKTLMKRYLVEFVSANPTGPLHLAHGRNGVIGDVLCSILSFLGHNVTREYYINDAGSQITKLGASLQARYFQALGDDKPVPEDGYAGSYLVELAKQLADDVGGTWKTKSVDEFSLFARTKMLEMIKTDLEHYGITFDRWSSEKALHDNGSVEKTIQRLIDCKATYESDGALWLKSTEYGDDKDRVLRKADGQLTYIAPDIAYYQQHFDAGYDKIINILGQDHHGYVIRRNAALKALGNDTDKQVACILYQLVRMKKSDTFVRMSKRSGSFEKLSDVVETVGKDIARFFYLNRKADAHLEFDLDIAFKRTEENPAIYIQYAYARTRGIFEKAASTHPNYADELEAMANGTIRLKADTIPPTAHLLLKKVASLGSVLASISESYQTHQLAYYTYELARLFHTFYAQTKIVQPDDQTATLSALVVVGIVRSTLKTCLTLLGLSLPERM
jgi:arginyl-tRNA synthetase